MLKILFSLKKFLYIEKVVESSTLFLSNTINLELHGIFAQRDLFPFIWTPRAIFAFFITFTPYKINDTSPRLAS